VIFVFSKKKISCVCFEHQASPATEISTTKITKNLQKKGLQHGTRVFQKKLFFFWSCVNNPTLLKNGFKKF
jgi:hypothetical protein